MKVTLDKLLDLHNRWLTCINIKHNCLLILRTDRLRRRCYLFNAAKKRFEQDVAILKVMQYTIDQYKAIKYPKPSIVSVITHNEITPEQEKEFYKL